MLQSPHPLLLGLLVALAARITSLFVHYFGRDPAGHAIANAPLNILLVAVPYHVHVLLILGGGFLLLWKFAGRARPAVTVLGLVTLALVLALGQFDLGLQRFLGSRLTPGVLATYLSPAVLSPEFYRPVLFDPLYLAVSLSLFVGPWIALGWIARRTKHSAEPGWILLASIALAAGLCRIPVALAYGHQRDALQPTEALYLDLLRDGDPTPVLPDQAGAIARLRADLDPAGSATWLSEDYPLLRTGGPASRYADVRPSGRNPPDVIVFFIESLRGMSVGYGDGARTRPSPTPNLDRLAAESVVFPHHLSNGNPSPRGFFSFHAGAWCHRDKFIISGFTNTTFDSMPLRLHAAGYRTMALWGSNPSFDNQLFWGRKWYDDLVYGLPEDRFFWQRRLGDDALMDRFLAKLAEHDRERAGQPLFAFIANTGTHEPYTLEEYEKIVPRSSVAQSGRPDLSREPDAQKRYDACLRFLDEQIGRVLAALAQRPRSSDTLIIVTGDHSDLTREHIDDAQRGLPVDAVVWTSLLLHGPRELIGPPRRESQATTHADILPTVLGIVGDRKPVATLGTDLFADLPAGKDRLAISGSGRGFRLDRDGWQLLVDARHPETFFTAKSFADVPVYRPTLDGTPFTPADVRRLWEHFQVWSRLVETDRVWPDQSRTKNR